MASKYAQWDDIVQVFPSVAQKGSEVVRDGAIKHVEAWIEGQLAPKFSIPFTGTNLTIKDLVIRESYYRLNTGKIKGVDRYHKDVMEDIKSLLAGDMQMVLDDGSLIKQVAGTVWSNTQGQHSSMGMIRPELMSVDSDTILEEYDERGIQY